MCPPEGTLRPSEEEIGTQSRRSQARSAGHEFLRRRCLWFCGALLLLSWSLVQQTNSGIVSRLSTLTDRERVRFLDSFFRLPPERNAGGIHTSNIPAILRMTVEHAHRTSIGLKKGTSANTKWPAVEDRPQLTAALTAALAAGQTAGHTAVCGCGNGAGEV